jgi:hypothetical protein
MMSYWAGDDSHVEAWISEWIRGAERLYHTGDEPTCHWLTDEQQKELFDD